MKTVKPAKSAPLLISPDHTARLRALEAAYGVSAEFVLDLCLARTAPWAATYCPQVAEERQRKERLDKVAARRRKHPAPPLGRRGKTARPHRRTAA